MDFNQLLTNGITWPKALIMSVLIFCIAWVVVAKL